MYKLPAVLFFERINGFNHPFYLLYNICSKIKCSKSKSLFQMENRKENMHWWMFWKNGALEEKCTENCGQNSYKIPVRKLIAEVAGNAVFLKINSVTSISVDAWIQFQLATINFFDWKNLFLTILMAVFSVWNFMYWQNFW